MQETRNDLSSMENETGHRVGGGYTPVNQLVSPVGPKFVIPFTSVDSQAGDQEPIHLYGQSQFHDNLGPVYAVPTFPSQHGGVESGGHMQGSSTHPHLFDEGQFHNNLGPVYALPTYPWPHGQHPHIANPPSPHGPHPHATNPPSHQGSYPHTGHGQWQHGGIHPSPMMVPIYCCGWQPMKCNHRQ